MKTLLRTIALLIVAACVSNAADAPATFKVSEFTFKRPGQWEWVSATSMMRKAQLRVPDPAKKDPGEVVFFHFGPGDGGGTKANVERWFGQFQEAKNKKSEEVKVGNRKVTYVRTEGTYSSGMPGQPAVPKANYALRGAIIESDQGNVFVKMTGPAPLVASAEGDFKQMVESALK